MFSKIHAHGELSFFGFGAKKKRGSPAGGTEAVASVLLAGLPLFFLVV